MPIRYADDFIILVASANSEPETVQALAEQEKSNLAAALEAQLGLTLSPEKTLVTPVTSTMRFLGHHLCVRPRPSTGRLVPRLVIPKDRSNRLRTTIANIFEKSTVNDTLGDRLRRLNPILRGWGNFYRHAWGAKRVFAAIDHHVWWTILRWLRKKHPGTPMRDLAKQYGWHKPRGRTLYWRDGAVIPMALARLKVEWYPPGADPGPTYS